ncbi:MAG: bifunctional cobalt-precorrin-7 (C(5))-methyltransferase/cobalt-precorrin-6B (C(15))-methyltransferase, partial [Lachnospiraceae bacterium]|nr:bifunctional cobalt-precorrin-7 (C(5))-methyltransferase/cobalt-precorrin-6B (C(15))-methyltransferase [Lachnospiraceae bacterium]
LIGKNKETAGLENITVVKGTAPESLSDLPAATHAFIGGSGGRLKEILALLRQKNPNMRVVINAVSMETICELREVLSMEGITEKEVVQLQANRVREAGSYHLVQSENPVWICAFRFCG